jgi:hypothetical protein
VTYFLGSEQCTRRAWWGMQRRKCWGVARPESRKTCLFGVAIHRHWRHRCCGTVSRPCHAGGPKVSLPGRRFRRDQETRAEQLLCLLAALAGIPKFWANLPSEAETFHVYRCYIQRRPLSAISLIDNLVDSNSPMTDPPEEPAVRLLAAEEGSAGAAQWADADGSPSPRKLPAYQCRFSARSAARFANAIARPAHS